MFLDLMFVLTVVSVDGSLLRVCRHPSSFSPSEYRSWLDAVVHTSSWEVEVRGSGVQHHLQLYRVFKASVV